MNTDIRSIRLVVRAAIPAFLMLAAAVVFVTYVLPVLAQESDPDASRNGAVSLGDQSPDRGRQFFYDKSLNRANGDGVDYYTFTTDGRYTLGLGARDQTIELKVTLEDADGSVVGTAGPPLNPDLDQVYIEWLQTAIDAGTYYVRVEALEDGQTGYYLRFGLEDAPNSAPEFGSAAYSFSVAEDAATGAAVGTVSATDADADADSLTYTIESGNGDGVFAIDGGTGAITTAAPLDHETTPSYALTVQADDGEGGTATATVNITVTDVEESTTGPLAGFTLVDASDQAVLASLTDGHEVELADPDGGSYGIRADVDPNTAIGSVRLELSGAKTVARTESVAPYSLYGDGGANDLHGESLPAGSYTLTATAYAESGLAGDKLGTLEISFTVTQANRAPEFGSAAYSFSVAEDASTGAAVGSVSATDADDDTLTYTIEAGNGDGKFVIDGGTGAITTAGALDHETTPSYALTVQADDGNGGTATATVNITVTDVDESTAGPLTGFTLVDASDQAVLATLTDGGSVELADPSGGSYAVRADVDANAAIGSVSLSLSGAKAVTKTENVAPYSLYGDGGANALRGESLPAGSYTLTATAYAESGLAGDKLGTLEVSFTVTAPRAQDPLSAMKRGITSDGVSFVQFLESVPASPPGEDDESVPQRASSPITVDPPGRYLLPQGLWSDNTTLWVSARGSSFEADEKLYAYVLSTGARDLDKDIQLAVPELPDPPNIFDQRDGATGLWMTADTIWSSAGVIDEVLAYHRRADSMATPPIAVGDRKSGRDFDALPAEARTPVGLWSNGADMYIADYSIGRIYVHNLSTGAHVRTLLTSREDGNANPVGLWSNGTIMWVGDSHDARVYAYALADWSREPLLDVEDLADDNRRPQGIWSDGSKLWVADKHSDKVFVYDLPEAPTPEKETRLRSLGMRGVNMRFFGPNSINYITSSPSRHSRTMVTPVTLNPDASFVIAPDDSQTHLDGHWVELEDDGDTEITVTVTSADGTETLVYTVRILQGEADLGWVASRSRLKSISFTGAPDPVIGPDSTSYSIEMEPGTYKTTVTAITDVPGVPVLITPADADMADGHQIDLVEGVNVVRVTVLAGVHRTYTFAITAGEGFTQLSAWTGRACALREDASLACWGLPSEASRYLNAAPGIYTDVHVSDVWTCTIDLDDVGECRSGARTYTVQDVKVLRSKQDRICWVKIDGALGCNLDDGEIPDGKFKFVEIGSNRYTCAIKEDGKAVCWGNENFLETYKALFDVIQNTSNAYKHLALELIFMCGLKTDDTVVCPVQSGRSAKWLDVDFPDTSCIVMPSNEAECVLRGTAQQREYSEAILTEPPGPFKTLSIGGKYICGLRTDKTVACWGHDSNNALDVPPIASPWADDPRLLSLELSGVSLNRAFNPEITAYTASVANVVDEVTVLARATNTGADIAYDPATDADGTDDGHQVSLSTGENTITVTVTSANGEATTAYTITVTRASP